MFGNLLMGTLKQFQKDTEAKAPALKQVNTFYGEFI